MAVALALHSIQQYVSEVRLILAPVAMLNRVVALHRIAFATLRQCAYISTTVVGVRIDNPGISLAQSQR